MQRRHPKPHEGLFVLPPIMSLNLPWWVTLLVTNGEKIASSSSKESGGPLFLLATKYTIKRCFKRTPYKISHDEFVCSLDEHSQNRWILEIDSCLRSSGDPRKRAILSSSH